MIMLTIAPHIRYDTASMTSKIMKFISNCIKGINVGLYVDTVFGFDSRMNNFSNGNNSIYMV